MLRSDTAWRLHTFALLLTSSLGACYFGGGGGGGHDGSGDGSGDGSDASGDAGSDISDDSGDDAGNDAADIAADVDVIEIPPCELDCGPGGDCRVIDLVPSCVCDEGYSGPDCVSCADGWQDNDGDALCMPACGSAQAPACVHGACSDVGGVAACVCDDLFEGDDCATCADGWQDNDGDGTCRPSCAGSGAPDCGDAACDDSAGEPQCVCGRGLVYNEADRSCIFATWPADPELVDSTRWTVLGAARFEPDATETMFDEPGIAYFDGAASCDVPMGISTRVDFADVPWDTGYAVSVTVSCVETGTPDCVATFPDVWVNGLVVAVGGTRQTDTEGARSAGGCLPPSVAGSDIELVVASSAGRGECAVDHLAVGRVAIVPSTSCPAAVGITDGTFDLPFDDGGWSTQGAVTVGGAERAAELHGDYCVPATLSTRAGVPRPGGAALMMDLEMLDAGAQIWFAGTINDVFGIDGEYVACIDHAAPIGDVSVFIRAIADAGAAECTDPPAPVVRVDNVRLETSSLCEPVDGVVGGDFSPPAGATWQFDSDLERWRSGGPLEMGVVEVAPGEYVGRMSTDSTCARGRMQTWIVDPDEVEDAALQFDYRSSGWLYDAGVSFGSHRYPLTPSTSWTSREICIAPLWRWSIASVEFSLQTDGPCDPVDALDTPGFLEVDNVRVVSSTACR